VQALLRSYEETKLIPVVVSASAAVRDKNEAYRLGAHNFVGKMPLSDKRRDGALHGPVPSSYEVFASVATT
jgi:hypothetical protein